ncbi:putative colanic acid biosynthesis acetyltransferase [Phycisphaera mikurensis]|nr:putative colanic acid biosynthesis acetyltransferase [Phycisphaera mikurensis]MBB6441775.1 putative colanic acid biosynthesis acetyltransferase WcaF [Phycisphaera mikurensis]
MLWALVEATLFRLTWPTWYRWRAFLLRCFGADVHPTTKIRRTCRFMCPWNLSVGDDTATGEEVWFYCLGPVTVGKRVTLSHFCKLCAGSHDYTRPASMPMLRPPIEIGDDAWVATDAFVGPGVTIGEGAILGARGGAFRSLEPWTVYVGSPCRPLKKRPGREAVTLERGAGHDRALRAPATPREA